MEDISFGSQLFPQWSDRMNRRYSAKLTYPLHRQNVTLESFRLSNFLPNFLLEENLKENWIQNFFPEGILKQKSFKNPSIFSSILLSVITWERATSDARFSLPITHGVRGLEAASMLSPVLSASESEAQAAAQAAPAAGVQGGEPQARWERSL